MNHPELCNNDLRAVVKIPQDGTNICSKRIIPRFTEVQRTVISVSKPIKFAVLCTLEALDYRLATNIEVLCTFWKIKKIPNSLVRKFGMIHV